MGGALLMHTNFEDWQDIDRYIQKEHTNIKCLLKTDEFSIALSYAFECSLKKKKKKFLTQNTSNNFFSPKHC